MNYVRSQMITQESSVITGVYMCGVSCFAQSPHVQRRVTHMLFAGLMQTDDRLALLEITRQLQLENTVGDRVFVSWQDALLCDVL